METTKRLAMLRERTAKLGQKKSKVEVLTMVCPKCKGGGIFEGKVCPRCKGQRTVLSSNLSDLRERLAKLKGRPRVEVVTMICPECKGSGLKEGGLCPKCKGKMTVLEVKKITELTNICPECKGGGFVGGKVCPKCKGTRAYSEPEHRVWGEELKKLRTRIRARKA